MRRQIAALLALPLLALPAACAPPGVSAAPQPEPTSTTPDPNQSYWPGQEEVMAAAVTIDDHGNARWARVHAGVATDLPGRAVEVHRIPTPGYDTQMRKLVPGMKLRFVDATHSAATLKDWTETIFNDRGYWKTRGVLIHSIGPEMGSHVDVEVDNPQRDTRRILAHYPHMDLVVRKGWPAVDLLGVED